MEIETYEINEVTAEGADPLDEDAIALCEKLGLEGQLALVRKDDEGNRRLLPYEKMTDEQIRVFSELFPQRTRIERYDAGPIPTRVLQVAALARDMFHRVEVWHVKEEVVKDPLLVGILTEKITGSAGHTWDADRGSYLLARWGDALLPFDELRRRAGHAARERFGSALRSVIAKAQSALSRIEHVDAVDLCGHQAPWISLPTNID